MNSFSMPRAICLVIAAGALFATPAQQTPGTWKNVTPNAYVDTGYSGVVTVVADPARPSDCWFLAAYTGVWKSTDFGLTWKKANTGTNGDKIETGRPWYTTIDMNPNRDPATSPTMYTTPGYGVGCVWKSTDGGVSWTNVWNNNIFNVDGDTNMSSLVGSDISAICIADKVDPNHVIVSLHSCWQCGDINGVFETTDGGLKWVDHMSKAFNFQPHSDELFAIDAKTWMVAHGLVYPNAEMQRTTDAGASWANTATNVFVGRLPLWVGNTLYGAGDFRGVYKTIDKGASWQHVTGLSDNVAVALASTGKYIYALTGNSGTQQQCTRALITNDAVWTAAPGSTAGMNGGACAPASMFDGTHWIIITPQANDGVWRYVEPEVSTTFASRASVKIQTQSAKTCSIAVGGRRASRIVVSSASGLYDVKGRVAGR